MADLPAVIRHISRPSLPWRASNLTRCGRPVAEMGEGRVISLTQARSLMKRRDGGLVCLTCTRHLNDWPEWDANPSGLMHQYTRTGAWGPARDGWINDDLRAIAALIERHRDEFDALTARKKLA